VVLVVTGKKKRSRNWKTRSMALSTRKCLPKPLLSLVCLAYNYRNLERKIRMHNQCSLAWAQLLHLLLCLGMAFLLPFQVSIQAILQILQSWQRCWAKLDCHLHHQLARARYHNYLVCFHQGFHHLLDFPLDFHPHHRVWVLLLSKFLAWEEVRVRIGRSRSSQVAGVSGGEDRCRVRKRVCRWSRGRGNILVRDDKGKGQNV
jgi:hypothetical protein